MSANQSIRTEEGGGKTSQSGDGVSSLLLTIVSQNEVVDVGLGARTQAAFIH